MQSSFASPLVGVGEVLWDLLPSGPRLGGATTNFCILSARLGDYAALVSRTGNDVLGRQTLERLRTVTGSKSVHEHLNLAWMQRSEALPTGTVGVSLDAEGRPRYTIEQPVAWDEITATDDLLQLAASASALCFGTLAQRQSPSREAIRAMVEATTRECIRVCDANLRMPFCDAETLEWCMRHATVLKISDEELPEVSRMLGLGMPLVAEDEASLTETARRLAEKLLGLAPQCRLIAFTLGPRGSLLVDRTGEDRHHGFAVTVSDTIGAGDAFTAGLVHAFVRGASLAQTNIVSNLCGSFVASQPGATPELPPELLERVQEALRD
jgi:fructokinase